MAVPPTLDSILANFETGDIPTEAQFAEAWTASYNNTVDVVAFGADPTGIADSAPAIQAAIDVGESVYFPVGTYLISAELDGLSTGQVLFGDGPQSVLIADNSAWPVNTGMVKINGGITDVVIRNMTLDAGGIGRGSGAGDVLIYAMLITNATYCTIEDVKFKNMGLAGSNPSSPTLLMVAKDVAGDYSEGGDVGPCSYNTIRNCIFEKDATLKASFCIRCITNWDTLRDKDSYTNCLEHNVFDNLKITDDFDWNYIEFAGGGTRYNTVSNCKMSGKSLSHIDFDKGCNYNTAIGNTCVDGGTATIWIGSQVMGVISDHGTSASYRNYGNKIIGNTIRNFDSASVNTLDCGIAVIFSENSLVDGNTIDGINATNGGAGIKLDRDVHEAVISNNQITNVDTGIRTSGSGTDWDNVLIGSNTVSADTNAISFSGGAGTNEKIKFAGNALNVTGSSYCFTISGVFIDVVISDNIMEGGLDVLQCSAVNAVISANRFVGGTGRSIRLNALATVTGNNASGASLGEIVYATDGRPSVQVGNSWDLVTASTSVLENDGTDINLQGKFAGKQVLNTTTSKPVYATGSAAADVWVDATGATAHTPV